MPAKPRPEAVRHALELFSPLGAVREKPMFGGWGFYAGELFFALIAYDTLYLKADDASEALFREAGSEAFTYTYPDGRAITMRYWSAPEAALDSPTAMAPWARLALEAALRGGKGKRPRRPPADA